MQKLIKINENHYVVVDDSEIREKSGDWFYSFETRKIYDTLIHHTAISCKKITHSTQPLECDKMWTPVNGKQWMCNPMLCCGKILNPKTEPLSLQEVKELIGEVDVENMADLFSVNTDGIHPADSYVAKKGYMKGYNQCLEDNKEKKYTEEDLRKVFDAARRCITMPIGGAKHQYYDEYSVADFDEYKREILPAHTPTEWEVEFIDGKLKLA